MQPNSVVQPFRRGLLLLGSGWRGFYSPFNVALAINQPNTIAGPKVLDLSQGPFTDAALLAGGFSDIGWIKDFAIAPEDAIGSIRSGNRGIIRLKVRGQIGEKISFKMREFSRMGMKIASGADIFNIIGSNVPSVVGPLSASGQGNVATAMVSYDSSAPSVTVASISGFAAGDIVVIDKDYDGSSYGLIGENATPVSQGSVTDPDYIRKTSDFIARVTAINGNVMTLSFKLVGGGSGDPVGNVVPQAGSKVQRVVGWTARKGGALIHEWTAVFKLDTSDGAQMIEYYPHLSISANKGNPTWAIENIGTTDLTGFEMDTEQEALGFDDPLDDEPVVGYRVYYPAPGRHTVQI